VNRKRVIEQALGKRTANMDEARNWLHEGAITCDAAGEVRELLFFPDPNAANSQVGGKQ
jgi:hypothetical protein